MILNANINTDMITHEEKLAEVEAKAEELSKTLNVKVHPIVFLDGDNYVEGYLKEPDRGTKMVYLDKAVISPVSAACQLLDWCLIKEHSSPSIMTNDTHYLGAATIAQNIVTASQNLINKKK